MDSFRLENRNPVFLDYLKTYSYSKISRNEPTHIVIVKGFKDSITPGNSILEEPNIEILWGIPSDRMKGLGMLVISLRGVNIGFGLTQGVLDKP